MVRPTNVLEGRLQEAGYFPQMSSDTELSIWINGQRCGILNEVSYRSLNEWAEETESTPQERSKPFWYAFPGGTRFVMKQSFQRAGGRGELRNL